MKKHWIRFLADSYGFRHLANDLECKHEKLNQARKDIVKLEQEISEMESEAFNQVKKEWNITEISEAKIQATAYNLE